MANVQYSGVRESKLGRVNDLGTTGKKVEEAGGRYSDFCV